MAVWKLPMRNPSEEGGSLICYVGQVWKLPMRNPSSLPERAKILNCSGLEATYEESKPLHEGSRQKRHRRLEATYEESKQLVEELLGGENHKFGSYL